VDLPKIFRIDLFESTLVGQVVHINVCHHDLIKIHVSFFEIVEEIPHGLPKLMLCRRINPGMSGGWN